VISPEKRDLIKQLLLERISLRGIRDCTKT
jgi:hypothetical protein